MPSRRSKQNKIKVKVNDEGWIVTVLFLPYITIYVGQVNKVVGWRGGCRDRVRKFTSLFKDGRKRMSSKWQ